MEGSLHISISTLYVTKKFTIKEKDIIVEIKSKVYNGKKGPEGLPCYLIKIKIC